MGCLGDMSLKVCDALILTCGLACRHPRDLPPPSQEPADRSDGIFFYIEGVVMIHIQPECHSGIRLKI